MKIIDSLRYGYRMKLTFSIACVGLVMMTALVIVRYKLLQDILYEKTDVRINSIGALIASDLKEDYVDREFINLQERINSLTNKSNISFISLMDGDNKVLYSSIEELPGRENAVFDTSTNIRKNISGFVKSFPVMDKSVNIATVQIGFVLTDLPRDLSRIFKTSVIMSTFVVLIIIAAAWLISGGFEKPLRGMCAVTQKVAAGDFSARVSVENRDIIGELGMALNKMIEQIGVLTADLNKKIKTTDIKLEEKTVHLTELNKELTKRTEELEISNKKLQEADKLKTEFVSIVSHELRTPLTGIIGFARTLLKLDLNEEQKINYLKIIEAEGKRLSGMIEDFLDISKIESNTIVLRLATEDINAVIRETVESFNVPENRKVVVELDGSRPKVKIDKGRIMQVIFNILENAFRYTPVHGKITVSTRVNGGSVEVSVEDEGIGIDKTDRDMVFDKFYRCSDDVTKKSRGSGLGLAISRGIVELHNGKIWVESEKGKGSAFIFSLPVMKDG
ncbi:MAG: HAMP domain-containing histidine kinase [Elusimicrobia bacterium]|nr:HAMP domain-containing histidine kinase [Elusimicrobiota bacterium]